MWQCFLEPDLYSGRQFIICIPYYKENMLNSAFFPNQKNIFLNLMLVKYPFHSHAINKNMGATNGTNCIGTNKEYIHTGPTALLS